MMRTCQYLFLISIKRLPAATTVCFLESIRLFPVCFSEHFNTSVASVRSHRFSFASRKKIVFHINVSMTYSIEIHYDMSLETSKTSLRPQGSEGVLLCLMFAFRYLFLLDWQSEKHSDMKMCLRQEGVEAVTQSVLLGPVPTEAFLLVRHVLFICYIK